jgi:signal transduction histidine kinase
MDISKTSDHDLLDEISRRFDEKKASIEEMEFMTKKLLDLNEKNKQAQDVKSKFLSLIKNEFNNPMSSLLNLVNIIDKKVEDEKVKELSSMMNTELLKLDFGLKNIFSASEIEAGEIANDYSLVNIKGIYEELTEYFNYIIKDKNLTISYNSECDENIISDSQKINIILLNLISNACEYSFNDAQVDVIVECDNDKYTLKVIDTGEGVSKDHAKDIYNRFTHFESGNTRITAGLGLGLSVARGFSEALDGSIDNITKDGKTIFIVTLPKVNKDEVEISQGFGSNEFMFEDNNEMVEF